MPRFLGTLLVVCLVSGAAIGTADAAKRGKKPKKKAPATFETEGSLMVGHPAEFIVGGVTRTEFLANCSMPSSQGLDGFVIELPKRWQKANASVLVKGRNAGLDMDMFFFADDCTSNGEAATSSEEEVGAFGAGTKYIFVSALSGRGIEFDVKVTEIPAFSQSGT
jgi:hypothetical protein